MFKKTLVISFCFSLSACADSPLNAVRGIFGYIPPPPETTISEELQLEYDRCLKLNKEKNCAQAAYDVVRTVKGLEPRKVPKGVVIILEGDGGHASEQEKSQQESQENDDKK